MNCKNCGTTNVEGALICTSCKVPLTGTYAQSAPPSSPRTSTSYIVCKNCKKENPVDALRCYHCQAPLRGSMVTKIRPSSSHAQIICSNCQTANDRGRKHCLSCNAPLEGSLVAKRSDVPSSKIDQTDIRPIEQATEIICSNCNYPNVTDADQCSFCNHPLQSFETTEPTRPEVDNNRSNADIMEQTINPWLKNNSQSGKVILTPLVNGEKQNNQQVVFDDEKLILNRSNLQSKSLSITSKTQACLFRDRGQWFIQDESEHQSTFVLATVPIELQENSVVLMGDQLYIVSFSE